MENNSESYEKTLFHSKWRPAMAWMYLVVCIFDFILGPVFFTIIQHLVDAKNIIQWEPMTVKGGGLFHMSMLAIVGVTAWGRTQEKLRMGSFGGLQVERETFETRPRNVDDEFDFEDDIDTPKRKIRKYT